MKRRVLYGILFGALGASSYFGFFVSSRTSYTDSTASAQEIGARLLDAVFNMDDALFKTHLQMAENIGNSEDANTVFSVKNADGYSLLLAAVLLGDIERLSLIFDSFEKVFGADKESLAKCLNIRDAHGHGIFTLMLYAGDRRIVRYVVLRSLALLRHDPNLSYQLFVNNPAPHCQSPLQYAAADCDSFAVELIVKVAKDLFGENGIEFKSLLNMVSPDGTTVLSCAVRPDDYFFIYPFVNKDTAHLQSTVSEPILKSADGLGKKLMQAVKAHSWKEFANILNQAHSALAGNPEALRLFLRARDEAGWSILTHLAASGHLVYVQALMNFVRTEFHINDQQNIFKVFAVSDFYGRTPIHLAISRREFAIAREFLTTADELIQDNLLFFALMTMKDETNGYIPLHTATTINYENAQETYRVVAFLLQLMARRFGNESRAFELYINSRDYNDQTPLAYVVDERTKRMLENAGAVDMEMNLLPSI